jgi:TRAP transporter 4TM/12TM fusion protein
MFTLFGITLFKSGGSAFFTDIAMALMGRYRGGPAKIAIVGSSLFGTISGSTVSNVLTTGVVTIPMMKRIGYRPHVAGAVEACASTGGQLMPPVMGIAAFIMAEFLQVSYAEVALAALIPAVLFYCALFIQVDLEAARNHMKPLEKSEIPPVGKVLKAGWYFPIPFVVLIYALFWLNYEAETAGLLATAVVLILAIIFPFAGKRINLHDIYEILRETGTTVLDLFMIGMAAGIILGSLNYAGIGFSLTLSLLHLGGGTMIGLLLLAAFASIILGMGMPTVGVYILLATLIAPALIEMKIEPMAAHLFIMYFGCLSMITPPVCIGAFAAANIAGADPMRTGYTSMALGWTCFVIPFLFVFSNTLIMRGSAVMIVIDFVTAVAAVWLLSAAIMGYSTRPLGLLDRGLYFVAGVCLMMPVNIFPEARYVNIVGALLGIGLLIWERFGRTERAAAPARSDA